MSESIKKNDIIQGDPFGEIAKQISEALGYLVKFDNEVKQTAKDLTALSTASTKTVQGIDAINRAEKESAKLVQEKIRNDKALEKLRLEEIRINKAREKSIDDYNKKLAKETKILADSANAYKQLEKATREQKNESKRLGAELLKLEANGEAGSTAFKKLESQYKATTAEAQKGDQQLKKLDKTLGDNFRSVGDYEIATTNLKTELRKLTVELQNMEQTDPRFGEMARRAGELKDQIGDTRGVIEALAGSTTERLGKGLASVGQIGISAFQGIEGAQALLGVKSEKLMEVMVRLQALASLSDALAGLGGLGDKLTEIRAGFKSVAQDISNGAKQMFTFKKASSEAGDAVKGSAEGAKGLGTALKGIGILAAVGLFVQLVTVLYDIASGAEAARDAAARLDKQLAKSSKDAAARTSERTADAEKQINELRRQRDENKITEKEFLQQKKAITEATKNEVKADIQKVNARKAQYLEEKKALELRIKTLALDGGMQANFAIRELGFELNQVNANIQGSNTRLKEYYAELGAVDEATKDLTSQIIGEDAELKKSTTSTQDKTKALEAYKVKLIELDEDVRNLFDPAKLEQTLALEDERAITVANIAVLEAEIALKKAQQVGDTKAIAEAEKAVTKAKIEAINAQLKVDLKNELDPAKRKELQLRAENDILGLGSVSAVKDSAKEALVIAQQFQAALTQIANDEINKRIELSKKEQDAAKSQQDYLQQLAANGNITAQQSIAETIEIQRAAQEEQMRLEKQKQNVELISAGLQTFNSSLASGKTPASALAETLVSTNVLVGLLKNLNFYEKGTDNAPGGLAVVDEKGAEIITDKHGNIKEVGAGKGPRFTMLDKGDKVYNATKSAAVFDAIANADKMRPMDSAGNSFDLMQLNGSLLNIEKAIKNQPTSSTEWGGILAGVGKVIETKTVGRSRIKNTFEI
jgi:hypothetical protein